VSLLWPWALVSLIPVAAAAAVALRKPLHSIVWVGSLRLWEQALASLGPAAARRARTVSATWVLLLAGATLGALAMARPVWLAGAPARRIAVAVYPAAELAGGEKTPGDFAGMLLLRLDADDRVQLILPAVMGGAGEFLTPDEAARRVADLRLLPAAGEDLAIPAGGDAQHLYRFAPATLRLTDGPRETTIALPASPGDVTIDAFAVAPPPADAPTTAPADAAPAQVLVAVRNHTTAEKRGEVRVFADGRPPVTLNYALPAGGRKALIAELPAADHYRAALADESGPGAAAFVVARRRRASGVAMIGRDDPLLRRFVTISPDLRLAADPAKADAVIAVGTHAPAAVPALVIDPPTPPPGWKVGRVLTRFGLRDANLMGNHPILAHTDLSAVVVRRAAGWLPAAAPPHDVIAAMDADAIVLAERSPPRVYLSFDTAAANTNFAMGESFVIFLANAFKHLAPAGRAGLTYESVAPIRAAASGDWKPLAPGPRGGPLPPPGLYRDAAGDVHAVSLTGLRSAKPDADPARRVAEVKLPPPQPTGEGVEFWPALLLAAGVLWLAGWAVRAR